MVVVLGMQKIILTILGVSYVCEKSVCVFVCVSVCVCVHAQKRNGKRGYNQITFVHQQFFTK
jgi:hypothetical protein